MVSGNKQKAYESIKAAVFDSVKDAVSDDRPADWESKTWARGLEEFRQISGQAADAVLSSMTDLGSVPLIWGTFRRSDMNRGVEVVSAYFEKTFTVKSYFKKRILLFKSSFEKRFGDLTKEWKEQSRVRIGVSSDQ